MPYVPTDWVDGSTVVGEALLDKIEQGIANVDGRVTVIEGGLPNKVDKPAGIADGEIAVWDAGTGTWVRSTAGEILKLAAVGLLMNDATLYRSAAATLKTDGELNAGGAIRANHGAGGQIKLDGTGGIPSVIFGSAQDTKLWRTAANALRTDSDLTFGRLIDMLRAPGDAQAAIRFYIISGADGDQRILFGPGGAVAPDVFLYRSAAGKLGVSGWLEVAGVVQATQDVRVRYGGAAQILLGDTGAGRPEITFGPATDTNLYRAAADVLKTDDSLAVAGGYGTAFPASPVHGQEFTLVDSATNPTYQWRFRFNANSVSAYKWEFIGGAPAVNMAAPATALTANTQVGATGYYYNGGAAFTLPRAGDWLVGGVASVDTANLGIVQATPFFGPSLGYQSLAQEVPAGIAYVALTVPPEKLLNINSGTVVGVAVTAGAPATNKLRLMTVSVQPIRCS